MHAKPNHCCYSNLACGNQLLPSPSAAARRGLRAAAACCRLLRLLLPATLSSSCCGWCLDVHTPFCTVRSRCSSGSLLTAFIPTARPVVCCLIPTPTSAPPLETPTTALPSSCRCTTTSAPPAPALRLAAPGRGRSGSVPGGCCCCQCCWWWCCCGCCCCCCCGRRRCWWAAAADEPMRRRCAAMGSPPRTQLRRG